AFDLTTPPARHPVRICFSLQTAITFRCQGQQMNDLPHYLCRRVRPGFPIDGRLDKEPWRSLQPALLEETTQSTRSGAEPAGLSDFFVTGEIGGVAPRSLQPTAFA